MGGFNLANLAGGPGMMPTRFGGGDPVGGPVMRSPMWPQPPDRDPVGGPVMRTPMYPPQFGGGGGDPVGGPVMRAPGFWPQQPPDRDPVGGPVMRPPGFGGPMWPQPSPWGGFGGGGGFGQGNPMMQLHQLNGLGMRSMY